MEGWYVAKVRSQKETSLVTFLAQWGVEVFFPRIVQPGRTDKGLVPLFPTYMFCRLDPEASVWPIAKWAPGMAYFLSCDGVPTRVPEQMVDYLERRVSQWNEQASVSCLVQGERVEVLGGPFAGLEGIFQRYLPSKQRCQILLEVVGRLTQVELPERDLGRTSLTQLGLTSPTAAR